MLESGHKTEKQIRKQLNVRWLQKVRKNRIFPPIFSIVRCDGVDWTIDCCFFCISSIPLIRIGGIGRWDEKEMLPIVKGAPPISLRYRDGAPWLVATAGLGPGGGCRDLISPRPCG